MLILHRRSRGVILILVVAVLGLLVVMGTAFLATSRTQSSASRQNLETADLDLASRSVLTEVQNLIYQSSCGADGTLFSGVWSAGRSYSASEYVINPADGRTYKCSVGHVAGGANPPPPSANWQLTSISDSNKLIARLFDYPERPNNLADLGASKNTLAMRDQSWLAAGLIAGGKDVSLLRGKRFNPAANDFTLSVSTDGETRVVNPNEPLFDGVWNMLPNASRGGIRYRYAFRIVDSNRFANLNVGQASSKLQTNATVLTSLALNCVPLFLDGTETSTNADRLNYIDGTDTSGKNGVRGRAQAFAGKSNIFAPGNNGTMLTEWQKCVLAYENFGRINGGTDAKAEWFDLADELEFRSYGTVGSNYMARASAANDPWMWEKTLQPASLQTGASDIVNTRRHLFTTYSFDRSIVPVTSAASVPFTLTVAKDQDSTATPIGTYRWPGEGAGGFWCRPLDVTRYPAGSSHVDVARTAIYLANALYAAGYSTQECMSYAINWLGQTDVTRRGSSITKDELCIAAVPSSKSPTPIKFTISAPTDAGTARYFAYSAQPFINEVALYRTLDGTNQIKLKDFAVELLNPYKYSPSAISGLSVEGWRLRVVINSDALTTHVATIPSTAIITNANPSDSKTEAGVIVFRFSGGNGLTIAAGSAIALTFDPPLPASIVDTTSIFLERPYDVGGLLTYVVVDQANLTPPEMSGTPQTFRLQRANYAASGSVGGTPRALAGGFDPWLALNPRFYSAAVGTTSLGKWNAGSNASDTTHLSCELPDRLQAASQSTDNRLWSSQNLIGDMVNYCRWANSNSSAVGVNDRLISLPDPVGSFFSDESKLKLDFVSDSRAATLTNILTTVDRTSDGLDQIGDGIVDSISELRLPGRINLNTAPVEVIYALVRGANANSKLDQLGCAQRAAYIVAYRDRTAPKYFVYDSNNSLSYRPTVANSQAANDPILTSKRVDTSIKLVVPDFSNAAHFPGRGIRSLAELQIPLGIADYTILYNNDSNPPRAADAVLGSISAARYGLSHVASMGYISGMGATWQKLLASATVRSDTFVVYGYLEGVKRNPNYDAATYGAFDNAGGWYKSVTTGVGMASRLPSSEDPIQLVGSRRFIAILDRSWCNTDGAKATKPKIIAYKELPR